MKIGIIGGGLMGLATALRLSKKGYKVTVFEKMKQLGGLATYYDYGPFVWDRFYHVILPSDAYLINFLNEIGLSDKLRWQKTLTGFYVNQQFYSMSNIIEFLRFPPLDFYGKVRLALTILYCSYIKNWQRLERIPVENWLVKNSGRNTFEKIWKPLLLAKLGKHYQRVSAVFIWSYIKRLFSARDSSAKKEQLGYVEGGYKTVFDRLENLLKCDGNFIYTNVSIECIAPHIKGGLFVKFNGKQQQFDKVIFTAPIHELQHVLSNDMAKLIDNNNAVEYLGVISMSMITQKALIPYYIVNIADEQIPFTGVIGMNGVVSPRETADHYVTFFPKYVLSDDPLLQLHDDEIRELFFKGIDRMFPDLKNTEIKAVHVNREFKVQPLPVLNYSNLVPKKVTNHNDFYVLNNSQFVNDTLNNNAVIKHVKTFVDGFNLIGA